MERIDRALCRLGLHKWSPWKSAITPLEPVEETGDILTDDYDFSMETLTKSCTRGPCGIGKIKRIIHW